MDMLKIKPLEKGKSWKQFMMDSVTHETLLQLSKVTGVSMSRLVSEMVEFCANRVEIDV
jgi:hypothetical protein